MKKSLVLGLCTVLVAGFAQADQYDDMVTKGLITPEIAVAKRLAVQEAAVKAPEVIVTSKALTGTATPVKSADQRVRPETTRSAPRVVGPLIAPELISNRAPGNLSAAELEIQALKSIGAEVPAYLYETVNAEHGIVPQRDPEVDPSRQGGDDIAAAVVIPSLPYSNSGTTVGYTNDYDSECPYTGSTSPDVVYSFTPGANVTVDLTLCAGATNYDSKLYVFADSPATVVACNDDACSSPAFASYVSQLVGVNLTAGTTYYIVVDGYGGQSGSYFLDITEGAPPCVDPGCPAGYTVAELEGACDDTNGGCNAAVPAYEPLAFGDAVCGTTWADVNRDTDWYEVLLPEDGIIDITLAAGCVPMNAYVLNTDCDALTVLGSAVALPNGTGTGVTECLPAGQYYVFAGAGDAAGGIFTGFPCDAMNPWHYGIEVNYTPCEYAPPCDTFVNSPIDPFTGVSLTGVSTVGAPDILDLGNGQLGYSFTAADWFTLDVNTCLAGTAFDTDSYL
ncbi:MAG: hypothetical protein KC488_10785, partial [Candidatus Cloacimonetes bacterium]|nr:hypothetical protein [Candidatus Cloacimonadota bacterium]